MCYNGLRLSSWLTANGNRTAVAWTHACRTDGPKIG
jgi:hypothetical protein